jgi:hypothetical protein
VSCGAIMYSSISGDSVYCSTLVHQVMLCRYSIISDEAVETVLPAKLCMYCTPL